MSERSEILVVLPAFNEAANLARLIPAIDRVMEQAGKGYACIVVDDGSTDATRTVLAGLASRHPLVLLAHPRNLGLGHTLRTGLKAAVDHPGGPDAVVVMDADNTHPPETIPLLLGCLDDGADVAIASRFRRGSAIHGLPLSRRLLSAGAAGLFKLTMPMRGVRDYTCGFRAYRVDALRRALETFGDDFGSESGFESSAELLLRLRALGARAREVPMVLRYDRREGASKMQVGRTVLRTLRMLWRRRLAASSQRGREDRGLAKADRAPDDAGETRRERGSTPGCRERP